MPRGKAGLLRAVDRYLPEPLWSRLFSLVHGSRQPAHLPLAVWCSHPELPDPPSPLFPPPLISLTLLPLLSPLFIQEIFFEHLQFIRLWGDNHK